MWEFNVGICLLSKVDFGERVKIEEIEGGHLNINGRPRFYSGICICHGFWVSYSKSFK